MSTPYFEDRPCCGRPDIWTNSGRWKVPLGNKFLYGVCVNCGGIVNVHVLYPVQPYVRIVTPEGISLLATIRWLHDELTVEQRWVRRSIVDVMPNPAAMESFDLDLERIA